MSFLCERRDNFPFLNVFISFVAIVNFIIPVSLLCDSSSGGENETGSNSYTFEKWTREEETDNCGRNWNRAGREIKERNKEIPRQLSRDVRKSGRRTMRRTEQLESGSRTLILNFLIGLSFYGILFVIWTYR